MRKTVEKAEDYLKGLVAQSNLGPEFKDILRNLGIPALVFLVYKDRGYVGKDELGDSEN